MRLRRLHRLLSLVLGAFILAHLFNHGALFFGVEPHLAVQEYLRKFYRHPLVEPVLIASFLVQMLAGLRLLWAKGWPKRFWGRLQVVSGGLLGAFLIQHISAALLTRLFKPEIDTNVFWAGAVVSRIEFSWYFAPYYFLGVTALFAHIAAVMVIRRSLVLGVSVLGAGSVLAWLLVMALMGFFYPVELPPAHEAYLDDFWF